MNRAIFFKTCRDSWPMLVGVTLAICLLEFLFVAVAGHMEKELEYLWIQKPFFQDFAKTLLGGDLGGSFSSTGLLTLGFAHPILFTLCWTFLLTTCTRVIVGEIERGTSDLLLTLPVSRAKLYGSVSVVWLACGIPICSAIPLGSWIGESFLPLSEPVNFSRLMIVAVNFGAMYVAVGGFATCCSAFTSRRGMAVTITVVWLLSSFLLNFLAQFWTVAEWMSMVGVLHYYRPLPIVHTGDWPWRDIFILLGTGLAFWSAGLVLFRRRDIPAA